MPGLPRRHRLPLFVLALLLPVLAAALFALERERGDRADLLRAAALSLALAAEQAGAAPQRQIAALPDGWHASVTDPRGNAVSARQRADGARMQQDARSPVGWRAQVSAPRPLPLAGIAVGTLLLLAAAVAAAAAIERSLLATAAARDADALQAQAELESRVALAHAQASAANQHLMRCQRLEVLGRLVGIAVHDFNNVLGVVANSTQLLQRRQLGSDTELPLSALNRAVDKGSQLTRTLGQFANRRAGRHAHCDLERHLPDLADAMRLVVGKRVVLSISVAPGTPSIAIDATDLELVLINLALNARDALPSGGRLWLDAQSADAADGGPGCVQINVTDDGAGMADDVAARAFEPFFSTRAGASGLGLAQVRSFCERAGGRARIAGTPGMGTTVSLLLPAATNVAAGDASGPAGPQSPGDARLGGRRLLLVDDNEELAHVTAMLLAAYGCDVEIATSAAQALALIDAGMRFDVVLSDVVMPGDTDGIALAQQLRRRLPDLPVVLISGYSSALASVPDFIVLQKPCSPDQLVGALAQALAPVSERSG